ncbi:MAG: polyprenyl synthetase family protein [Planctomycetota bacterium]
MDGSTSAACTPRTPAWRLAALYAPIADELARSRQILHDELISDQGFISDLCRHVDQFHGKLLRPAVLLLAARAAGNLRPEHAVLGAVVELVHIATLLHDDVLDEADIRRRAATVNRLWGNHRAVLMGDFLYSHAFHLCSSLDARRLCRGVDGQYAARLVGQTAVTVCEGEMMQVARRGDFDLSEADYLDIIRRKTAGLVETCCQLGAAFAGAEDATVRRLRHYGRNVGLAFQIVDDLLDLTGEECEVGKSLGRDVHEGEVTLPIIHSLRSGAAEQRARLSALLRNGHAPADTPAPRPTGDSQRHREIATLLRASASIAYAERVAREHVQAARTALAELPPSPARDSLDTLAEFVLARRQ